MRPVIKVREHRARGVHMVVRGITKTKNRLWFVIDRTPLETVKEYEHLGLMFSSNETFLTRHP